VQQRIEFVDTMNSMVHN